MPGLDQLFAPGGPNVPAAMNGAQCFEAKVVQVNTRGVFVVIPGYDRNLRWGPCMPENATATVGDRVTIAISNAGRPWLMGAGTGGGGWNLRGVVDSFADLPASDNEQGDAWINREDGHIWVWNGVAWQDGGPFVGPQGPPGDRGAQGEQGERGPQGLQGGTGATGPIGATGPRGDTGDTGPQGEEGPEGPQGEEGPQGPSGTMYDTDQIGTVKAWSGAEIPRHWMLADGRELDRLEFASLWEALGEEESPWGQGDGETTFNLPDLRGRMMYGAGNGRAMGVAGGAERVALAIADLPTHAHGGGTATDFPDHGHSMNFWSQGENVDHAHSLPLWPDNVAITQGGPNGAAVISGGAWSSGRNTGHSNLIVGDVAGASARHTHGITAEGGGASHENLPPFLVVALIVKATGVQLDADDAIVGPQGPPGPQGDRGPRGYPGTWDYAGIAPDRLVSSTEGDSPAFTVPLNPIYGRGDGTMPFRFTVTPTEDCWWGVEVTVLIMVLDAMWVQGELSLVLDRDDALGLRSANVRAPAHNAQSYVTPSVRGHFALEAGITYTCTAAFFPASGGTWVLHRNATFMGMHNYGATPREAA